MSFCARPTVAAKKAVSRTDTGHHVERHGAYSNIGDSRQTMKTPAVTMVAAWIRAETGVGPSMASGSQVQQELGRFAHGADEQQDADGGQGVNSKPKGQRNAPTWSGTAANTVSNWIGPNSRNVAGDAERNRSRPTRLTRKALIAAALADGR